MIARVHKGLQGITRDGIQRFTGDYKGLRGFLNYGL